MLTTLAALVALAPQALPDLEVVGFSVPGGAIEAGTTVTLPVTIRNNGPANAPTSQLDLFIAHGANRGVIPTIDYYAGPTVVSALPAGIGTTVIASLRILKFLPAGQYTVGAIIDYGNAIPETNESNNTRNQILAMTVRKAVLCEFRLEVNQPLDFLGWFKTISASAGSSTKLEITAPCNAGDNYLVAVSLTGGTTFLPNNVRLPLFVDNLTPVAQSLANLPPYTMFAGTLDVCGRATATFHPGPGALPSGNYQIFFAPVSFTNQITGASVRAVSIQVRP